MTTSLLKWPPRLLPLHKVRPSKAVPNRRDFPDRQPPKFKRILLKLSGEALMGGDAYGINRQTTDRPGDQGGCRHGVQIGVVIGGGNIFRVLPPLLPAWIAPGRLHGHAGDGDEQPRHVGMRCALPAFPVASVGPVDRAGGRAVHSCGKAIRYLEQGQASWFCGRYRQPVFTTDTAAALRGAEIGAEIVLKATKVDGIYTADPKDASATRYDRISFDEAISRGLGSWMRLRFGCAATRSCRSMFLDLQDRRAQTRRDGRERRHAGLLLKEKFR